MEQAAEITLGNITLANFALIAGATVFASLVSGMSGFGGGLIIAAVIAPIIGVKALVPVIGIVMLFNNAGRVWVYRHGLDLKTAGLVFACSAPTAIFGAYFYSRLDDRAIALILGLVLIASVPLRRWLAHREIRLGARGLGIFGVVWGFMNSTMIGTGLLVIPVLMGAGLFSQALLATDAAIAVGINIVKAIAFSRFDVLTFDLILAATVIGLFTFPGTWAAGWIVKRTSLRIHTLLMEAIIVIAGASFIWHYLRG
ncbi:MAG: hypothetical protein RL477_690 [Pseudomonadota bacterium]|jgi:uncharacterized membrane protein YfcA